jgi:hypothetical protein
MDGEHAHEREDREGDIWGEGKAQKRKEGAAREALAGMFVHCRPDFYRLYNSTSQRMVLFIVKAKRTSNLEYNLTSSMQRW